MNTSNLNNDLEHVRPIKDKLTKIVFSWKFEKEHKIKWIDFNMVWITKGNTAKALFETLLVEDDERLIKLWYKQTSQNPTLSQLPQEYEGVTLVYENIWEIKRFAETE